MNRKLLLSLAGASAAVVMAFGTAQAAPGSSTADALRSYAQQESATQDVYWRRRGCHVRCHWHRGHRHCRRVCHRRWY
jgi:1,6-anhydro-N-acetylmuramate kinase